MASNFTLGTAWVDIRGKSDKLAGDLQDAEKKTKAHSGGIHAALRGVHRTIEAVTGGAGGAGIGAALAGTPGAIVGGILDKVGQVAGKANPAAMTLFNQAFDNFQASIGQALVPALNVGTQALQVFGKAADGIATKLAPAVDSAAGIAEGAFHWIDQSLKGLGVSGAGATATRPAQISSVSEYLKSTYQGAASLGGAGGEGEKPSWWNNSVDATGAGGARVWLALQSDLKICADAARWIVGQGN